MQEGLTQEEIGDRRGISQPVVSRVLGEALEQLGVTLESQDKL